MINLSYSTSMSLVPFWQGTFMHVIPTVFSFASPAFISAVTHTNKNIRIGLEIVYRPSESKSKKSTSFLATYVRIGI